jgi:PAS domain S-box-containing protein
MPATVLLDLTRAISRSRTVDEIYRAALEALAAGLGVERSAILLFDPAGVMRFEAARGLSDAYKAAIEGHTPWAPDSPDPEPIVVQDVSRDSALAPYLTTIHAEGIAAMAFIPLVSLDRVIGKFMLYYRTPGAPTPNDLKLAQIVAAQVAFAVERTRAEEQSRRSAERLRFALDAAAMGTWDWDLVTNSVHWSDNLERIHGLPPGSFDGSFASYEREIHPDDRQRVFASIQQALEHGVPHEVEYRLVAPDGTVRWCEGKGRVEMEAGKPVRMSGVCMMVTRRKEAEIARLQAAEEASRLKDEFLATLSHELRTPLNAIVGWTEMLQRGVLSLDQMRHAVEVIGRNARLQAQLIEDILDVSRIITGKLEIEREPLAVAPLVDAAMAAIAPSAAAKRIRVTTERSEVLPPIEGDPRRLTQVLHNLLGNAVKFTPDGGSIALACRVDGDGLTIEICDSGVGIAPEFLPYVFDRFRQADSRSTRRHSGLGLGLAIAQHLVSLHGGTISAHSDGPGKGTTMTLRLPLAVSASKPALAEQPTGIDPASLADLSIVVVDDQADSRDLVTAVLAQRGARVEPCDSAAAALAALRARRADALVADIAMPEVDGYELIGRIRAAGLTVPAIAVTAYARPDDRQRALAAGYAGYCAKPIEAATLIQAIRALVPRRTVEGAHA